MSIRTHETGGRVSRIQPLIVLPCRAVVNSEYTATRKERVKKMLSDIRETLSFKR